MMVLIHEIGVLSRLALRPRTTPLNENYQPEGEAERTLEKDDDQKQDVTLFDQRSVIATSRAFKESP